MNENHKHDIIYLSSFFAVFSLAIILATVLDAYPYLTHTKPNSTANSVSSTPDIEQIVNDYIVNAKEDIRTTFENSISNDFHEATPVLEDVSAKEIKIGKYTILLNEVEEYGESKFNQAKIMLGKKVIKEIQDDSIIVQKISFTNSDFYTIQRYTGGAHCCFVNHSLVFKNDILSLGNVTLFGNSIGPDQSNIFIKDGQLYFYSYDDRFAYFGVSYSASHIMFYPNVFHFDETKGWVNVSSEFKDRYTTLASKLNMYVLGLKDLWSRTDFKPTYPTEWLPWVVSRAIHQRLAGESDDKVWAQMQKDYSFFNKIDRTEILFYELKSDIIETMKPNRIDLKEDDLWN